MYQQELKLITLSLGVVAGLSLVTPATGQSAAEQDKDAADQKKSEYAPLGARMGTFLVHPGIDLDITHDSNIFRISQNEQSDLYAQLKPYVNADSTWNRHALNFSASGDFSYHDDFSNEDWDDYTLNAGGRVDVKRDSYATAKLFYMDGHEDRSSPNSSSGRKPTPTTTSGGQVGYDHKFNRLKIGVSYQEQDLEFDDVPNLLGGIVNNHQRNRSEEEVALRLGYELKTGYEAFIESTAESIDYDEQFDSIGIERSSNNYRFAAGVALDVTEVMVGEIYIGNLIGEYDDPIYADVDDVFGGVSLKWLPSGLTTVNLSVDESIEEITDPASSSYLSKVYALGIDHELKRNVLLDANLSYADDDYQTIPGAAKRNDETVELGFGVKYLINRNYHLAASYGYEDKESTAARNEYTANKVTLSIGSSW